MNVETELFKMTTVGVLAALLLASLLIALLDMGVYKESFGAALGKQGLNYNGFQTYLLLAAALGLSLFRDWRSTRRARRHKRQRSARKETRGNRTKP
ncbi:hypothetical protein AB4Z29_27070 [Paenibacillus sp. 2TAB23]|uniref:hypothetical protein n=1 Tax=Paenibacillus sp. 2TAB23 TaxID=3233004 RepID=UPI003F95B3EE